ncbi:acetyl-CoA synthetase-like protein [Neoconidiobolus thromboides FSU 785]|nr:acetyl-CoA synthetase-like protein [Neoconidiobolus thromboides FSU 785]
MLSNSLTIVPFPSNGRICDVVHYQAIHNPDELVFKYQQNERVIEMSYLQFYHNIQQSKQYIQQQLNEVEIITRIEEKKEIKEIEEENDVNKKKQEREVNFIPVAYLSNSNHSYAINLLALMQLNLVPILLSPKNSIEILKYLILKSKCKIIVVDRNHYELAMKCKKELNIEIEVIKTKQEYQENEKDIKDIKTENKGKDTINYLNYPCLMMHSSGSTSEPKLYPITNQYLIEWIQRNYEEIENSTFFGVGLSYAPLFHGFGLAQFFKSLFMSSCIAIPDNKLEEKWIFQQMKRFDVNYLILLPFLLNQLIEYCQSNKDYLVRLQSLTNIVTGGALVSNELLKSCYNNKVKVTNNYGSTETGFLAANWREDSEENCFDRFKLAKRIQFQLTCINQKQSIYQLAINNRDIGLANKVVINESGFYLHNDLFKVIKYNKDENELIFEIMGRMDDIIIHSNGEKTNPNLIELKLNNNNNIKYCLVYGTNQLYNCIIIQLKENIDEVTQDIKESIYKQIYEINQILPSHSRIFEELIFILPNNYHKQFITTSKGNIIRKKNEVLFKDEINQLYSQFNNNNNNNNNSNNNNSNNNNNTIEQIQFKLQFYFQQITNKSIKFNDNLFNNGMDSLCIIKYKNLLIKEYNLKSLNINTIYQYDTIQLLSKFIFNLLNNNSDNKNNKEINELTEYQSQVDNLIKKYTTFSDDNNNNNNKPSITKLSVLITGANGSLSNFIIQELINLNNINKIYCLIRGNSIEESKSKLKLSFQQRKIQITQSQWNKIQILNLNINDSQFGLNNIKYKELLDNVNVVYHSAWLMNFLKPLNLFEENIQFTVNLLNFSIKSKYRLHFHFISSIASLFPQLNLNNVTTYNTIFLKQTSINSKLLNTVHCSGYALSKLITENILLKYSLQYKYSLFISIHRIGQISGDDNKGIWNTKEHIPLFIKAIKQYNLAPENYQLLNWIPVNTVAKGLIELNFINEEKKSIIVNHIANPNNIKYNQMLLWLKEEGIEFNIINNQQFLELLHRQQIDNKDIGFIHSLLEFFELGLKEDSISYILDTKETEKRSKVIKECQEINKNTFVKYLEYWKENEFL